MLINEPVPEDEPIEEKRERVARLIGFKAVRAVFTLSQTEGKDLPPAQIPNWDELALLAKFGIRLSLPQFRGSSHGMRNEMQ